MKTKGAEKMKRRSWRKDMNYRRYENEDGTFRYVIIIGNKEVEVGEKLYVAYSKAERRERYEHERDVGKLLSLEQLFEDGTLPEQTSGQPGESAENIVLKKIQTRCLAEAFGRLDPDEQKLICALVIDGMTERMYAAKIGLSQKGVNKRKHKALKTLREIFESLVLKQSGFRT
jgi:RNA polymerase sigma factor (sigma-70 family)